MLISDKQLLGLSVVTESGTDLGSVSGFDINVDSHSVWRYHVRSHHLIRRIFGGELLISYTEVISISEDKMVVSDNTSDEGGTKLLDKIREGASDALGGNEKAGVVSKGG